MLRDTLPDSYNEQIADQMPQAPILIIFLSLPSSSA